MEQAIKYAGQGKVVVMHGQSTTVHQDQPALLQQDFEFTLGAYLITAGNSTFFSYSTGRWYLDGYQWHAEYERALGEPLGPAVRGEGPEKNVWTREFANGLQVTVNTLKGTAELNW